MTAQSRKMHDPSPTTLERGRDAYQRKAWQDAFDSLTRADESKPLGSDDLERLVWCAALAGRHEASFAALERLHDARLAADDVRGAARAAFWLGFRLTYLGEMSRGNAWVARADDLVERYGAECPERGYLQIPKAYLALFRKQDAAACRDLAIEAVAIGTRCGDAELVCMGRAIEGHALIALGDYDAGLAQLDQSMLPVTSGQLSPMVTGIVYCTVIGCCQRVHAIDRSREWTAALDAWCESQPQLGAFTGNCRVHRSEIMQLRGDWPEAIEEARLAIERFGHVLEPTATAFALYQQGEIQRLRGEFVEAESAYRRASELGRVPQPGLALLRLEQGQPDVAAAAIRQVVGATSDPYVRTRYLPAAVEILIATGDVAGATEAAREIEAMAAGKGNPVLDAMAAHAAGSVRLAETDARHAVEPLRRAFEGWQSIGAPYLAARIRVQIGAALDTLGDRDGAQLEREAAAKVFRELGAAPDLARLEVPAPGAAKAPDQTYGLTTRELEVLRLLARGGTNREMAEALFLSEKTIDRHVSNIFTKLDVHTRAAATAFAYEHRLL